MSEALRHPAGESPGVLAVEHLLVRGRGVQIRIEGAVLAIDERQPDRLGQADSALRRVDVLEFPREALVNVEHLHERASGARQRHREHPVAPEANRQRPPFDGMGYLGKIVGEHDPAVGLHVLTDEASSLAEVEVLEALLAQTAQRASQDRLGDDRAGAVRPPPVLEEELTA